MHFSKQPKKERISKDLVGEILLAYVPSEETKSFIYDLAMQFAPSDAILSFLRNGKVDPKEWLKGGFKSYIIFV